MDEIEPIHNDPTRVLLEWRGGKHGADLGHFIRKLGLPPSEVVDREMGIKQIYRYIDIANDAAEKHIQLREKIGYKEKVIFSDSSLPRLSVKYRDSIPIGSEGLSTVEIRMKQNEKDGSQPIFHARFMRFDNSGLSHFAVTGLQRYTDEHLSPVSKPFYSTEELARIDSGELVEGYTPLKEKDPRRYKEYQRESDQIKRIEKALGVSLPTIAVATCAALAKACGDQKFLLTTYQNQLWVKEHDRELDQTEIPNIYDPTAEYFGLPVSKDLPGFYELDGKDGGIVYPAESRASDNIQIKVITQSAFVGFLNEMR